MLLISTYSMRPLIRFLSINRVSLQSGKTPGTDKMCMRTADEKLEMYYKTSIIQLKNLPTMKVRYVEIPKPNGKTRGLGICNIEDRVLQTQLCLLLDTYYEAKYPEHMYGFRKGRGALQAAGFLKSVLERADNHRLGIISLDIEKCFDNIDHDMILNVFEVPTI